MADYIDLHTHILPGLDDGARTMDDALDMAQTAVDSGVRVVVATPHNPPESRLHGAASLVEARVRELQYRLRLENIPLRVLPGMEIMASEHTPRLLAEGHLLPLCGTRYALVEFDFTEDPDYVQDVLRDIRHAAFVPVVAHPERYFCVQEEPREAVRWQQAGCLLQVNEGSLLGRFGEGPQVAAEALLTGGSVAAVASDAHSPLYRTTDLAEAAAALGDLLSPQAAEILLHDIPARLLADDDEL